MPTPVTVWIGARHCAVVAATLGHDNISTTSAYLHAKPGATSGDALDAEVWKITPEA